MAEWHLQSLFIVVLVCVTPTGLLGRTYESTDPSTLLDYAAQWPLGYSVARIFLEIMSSTNGEAQTAWRIRLTSSVYPVLRLQVRPPMRIDMTIP